jgi:hypothetical protein
MRKLLLFFLIFLVSGCAFKKTEKLAYNIYQASCGGPFDNGDICYEAAKERCSKGIKVIEEKKKTIARWNKLCNCATFYEKITLTFSCLKPTLPKILKKQSAEQIEAKDHQNKINKENIEKQKREQELIKRNRDKHNLDESQ